MFSAQNQWHVVRGNRIVRTRFLALETDYPARELSIHIQRLLSRHGVLPDDGMDVLDGFSAHDAAAFARAGEIGLLNARVDGSQGAEERDELGGQLLQGRYLGREEGVPARLGLREEEEGRQARRLQLVTYIRMPYGGCYAVADFKVESRVSVAEDRYERQRRFGELSY